MSDRAANRHPLLPLALLLAMAGALSCGDAAGPEDGLVRFHVAPSFAAVANAAVDDQPALLVDNIRLEMKSGDGVVLLDTIVVWPVDQDTLRIEIAFEAPPGIQSFGYLLEARIGDVPLFAMEGVFDPQGPVLDPVLDYVGPGASAATATIAAPASVLAGDTVRLAAVVRDAEGATLDDVAVLWSSLDVNAATVDPAGLITAGLRLDLPATIVARVPFTSVADTLALGVVPASVTASPALDTVNALGDTAVITAAAFAVDGRIATGGTFEWTMVEDSAGLPIGSLADAPAGQASLVALATGVARVAVMAGGAADTAEVLVRQVPATLVLRPGDTLLAAGDSIQLTALASDSNGIAIPDAAVTWFSGDSAVAEMAAGRVGARLVGTTPVGARLGDLTATVEVEVVPGVPAALTLSPDSIGFAALADSADVAVAIVDAFGNLVVAGTVSWSGGDGVAEVPAPGRVVATAPGTGLLVATSGAAADTLLVVVDQVAVDVTLTADSTRLAAGAPLALTVTATDANGFAIQDFEVVWASSDSAVAVPDATGVITGVLADTAALTVHVDDAADTLTVEILPAAPDSVEITPGAVQLDALGDTLTLSAAVTDAFGNPVTGGVTWSVIGGGITVSAAGLIEAVAVGTDSVVATAGAAADTVMVTVLQAASSIEVSPTAAELVAGEPLELMATVRDANGNPIENAGFIWSTSHPERAMVDGSGLVSGAKAGPVEISATYGDLQAIALLEIVPGPPDTVLVTPDTLRLDAIGDTASLEAVVMDAFENVVAVAVSWSSSDASIALIDTAGVVKAASPDTTSVIATVGLATGSAVVIVDQIATAVELIADSTVIAAGDSIPITLTATDANGHPIVGPEVVWSSSDSTVAMPDTVGVVTGAVADTATITARVDSATGSIDIIVVPGAPATIDISPPALEFTALGDTLQLTATVRDAASNVTGDTVVWMVGMDGLLHLGDGRFTTRNTGSGTVTATAGNASATVPVDVTQVVDSVAVTQEDTTLLAGDSLQLDAKAFDRNQFEIFGATFAWTSSDPDVTVHPTTGLVTTALADTATITATADGVADSVVISVVPGAPVALTATPSSHAFTAKQETIDADATVTDKFGNIIDTPITWSVADTFTVSVDNTGLIRAVEIGTDTVVAAAAGLADSIPVTVTQEIASILVEGGGTVTPFVGDRFSATAVARDHMGNPINSVAFTWSVDDANTVEQLGFQANDFLAISRGQTQITARAELISGSAPVSVTGMYVATVEPDIEGLAGIQVLTVDDEATQVVDSLQVTPSGTATHASPAFSRDGRYLAYAREGQIVIHDMDFFTSRVLLPEDLTIQEQPDWSPDGSQIAFIGDQELVIASSDGVTVTRPIRDWPKLEGLLGSVQAHPSWSPEGNQIAFIATGFDGRPTLWVLDVDLQQASQLDLTGLVPGEIAWSPVDDLIAFSESLDFVTTGGIWLTRASASDPFQVTQPEIGLDQHPTWSPNGQWLAFGRCFTDVDGCHEIWLIDRDGKDFERLAIEYVDSKQAGLFIFRQPFWGRPILLTPR